MFNLSDYLPQTDGWLPYWLLLTSSAGVYMAISNVLHPLHNRIIYTGKPEEGVCSPRCASYESWLGVVPPVSTVTQKTDKRSLDPTVTPLSGRTCGIWTLTSAVVRLFCAYHISEKTIFDLAICTYVIALAHFGSEFLIYKTAKAGGGVISPLIVASEYTKSVVMPDKPLTALRPLLATSLVWMSTQYDFYVKN
ncbi:ergosterol biosynthesis protein [Serendipita sp. 405]|nr:ergosterol biosynthesis protein [Serendipita sp. 405]